MLRAGPAAPLAETRHSLRRRLFSAGESASHRLTAAPMDRCHLCTARVHHACGRAELESLKSKATPPRAGHSRADSPTRESGRYARGVTLRSTGRSPPPRPPARHHAPSRPGKAPRRAGQAAPQ